MSDDLRRAANHEAALAVAILRLARAVDSAPKEAQRALLADWKRLREHHDRAARDLRIQQVSHAAGAK